MFYTISKDENYEFEVVEKKSKFIAILTYVDTIEDAENKIKDIKKKYHDARHNCSAYRVLNGDNVYEKSSDDGEPSGTAGAPMLNILKKNELCNVLVIVTRYFGGILLGTGGLVRCYSDSTIGCIEKASKLAICKGSEYIIVLDYNYLETFKYYCKKNNINIVKVEYSEKISCQIELENEFNNVFLSDIEKKNINLINYSYVGDKYITKMIDL